MSDPQQIDAALGHVGTAVTGEVYGHLADELGQD
ncbi:hypothetical protein SAMN05421505_16812 [Sinosporangium album]|uniref:Uncharacterized protein n=1 Tax=Sinosporangium album TaxID=504805 RepID=A0A1G8LHU0_9ACTN|nr:hypothetical protein SAMN05421505_16812 [Sinosporangium album]